MAFAEVKAPEQLRFEKFGDGVEGVLVGITSHTVKGKKTLQYTVVRKDGSKVTFLALWDLLQVERKMLGYPISVTFEKYHDSIEKNGNCAKLFKVLADLDATPIAHVDSLEITDEDVPF